MSGSKTLVNRTGYTINIVLNVRKGSNPQDHLRNVDVPPLANGQSTFVQYGDSQNPFLNGVSYEYKPDNGGSLVSYSQQVAVRGSRWDDVLNTNDTLTFHDVSTDAVTGSN